MSTFREELLRLEQQFSLKGAKGSYEGDKTDPVAAFFAGKSSDKKAQQKPPEKWVSAGGVVLGGMDDLDHVYIRKPTAGWGPWSFPKGKIDRGETREQAALREVEEEIGIVARILPGSYLGTGEGGYSITHYYVMVAERNLGRHDKETEKVLLATWTEAVHKFAKGSNMRDMKILTKAMDFVEKLKRAGAKR